MTRWNSGSTTSCASTQQVSLVSQQDALLPRTASCILNHIYHVTCCVDHMTMMSEDHSFSQSSDDLIHWCRYYVNRDTLFCYHKASEHFLHNLMSLYVSSHYKNSPNDLQLLSDAPAHHMFVLVPPVTVDQTSLPDVLCVLQVTPPTQSTPPLAPSPRYV